MYRTVTDEAGKYEAKGVDPGQYQVYASRSRFRELQQFLAARREGPDPHCRTEDGRRRLHVDASAAVIEGRVVNRNGAPMERYYVTPLVFKYVGGRRVMVEAQGSPVTNDAGEYRLTHCRRGATTSRPPRAATAMPSSTAQPSRARKTTSRRTTREPPTRVPPARWKWRPGRRSAAVNITLVKSRVTRVSGRVVNQTGVASRSASMVLTPAGIAGVFGLNITAGPQGEFEFRSVPPGPYTLDVRLLRCVPRGLHCADGSRPRGLRLVIYQTIPADLRWHCNCPCEPVGCRGICAKQREVIELGGQTECQTRRAS